MPYMQKSLKTGKNLRFLEVFARLTRQYQAEIPFFKQVLNSLFSPQNPSFKMPQL